MERESGEKLSGLAHLIAGTPTRQRVATIFGIAMVVLHVAFLILLA